MAKSKQHWLKKKSGPYHGRQKGFSHSTYRAATGKSDANIAYEGPVGGRTMDPKGRGGKPSKAAKNKKYGQAGYRHSSELPLEVAMAKKSKGETPSRSYGDPFKWPGRSSKNKSWG